MGEYLLTTVSMVGVAAAVGLSINHLMRDSNYQVLRREGFVPVAGRNDPAWKILIGRYGREGHPVLGSNLSEGELFEWCGEILMANHTPESYDQSKRWCIRPKTNGETILENRSDLGLLGEDDEEEWGAKVKEYSSWWRFSNDISMRRAGDVPVLKSDLDIRKLKIWCENKNGDYYLGEDSEDFKSLIRWCYAKKKDG